jgi:hypothetical protein
MPAKRRREGESLRRQQSTWALHENPKTKERALICQNGWNRGKLSFSSQYSGQNGFIFYIGGPYEKR